MFKLQEINKATPPIWVSGHAFVIGSDPKCNISIEEPNISPVHAALINRDNRLFVKDQKSQTGTFVNDILVRQKELYSGDILRIGNTELQVMAEDDEIQFSASQREKQQEENRQLWSLVADSSWLSGQEFWLKQNPTIIGRSSLCDITIPGTHLSRQHAEIRVLNGGLAIKDLASANGTYINGHQINEETLAQPGDQIKFDVYSFRVLAPTIDTDKTSTREILLKMHHDRMEASSENSQQKRWKTPPTSPGNRDPQAATSGSPHHPQRLHMILAFLVVASVLITGAYLLMMEL